MPQPFTLSLSFVVYLGFQKSLNRKIQNKLPINPKKLKCKKLLKSKKGFDKKLPLMAQPFLSLYILIQQFRITIDSVHRSYWRRAKKSETKKRTFSETDLYFFFSRIRDVALFTELYYSWRCCVVETSGTSFARESRSHLIDKSFSHFLPNIRLNLLILMYFLLS